MLRAIARDHSGIRSDCQKLYYDPFLLPRERARLEFPVEPRKLNAHIHGAVPAAGYLAALGSLLFSSTLRWPRTSPLRSTRGSGSSRRMCSRSVRLEEDVGSGVPSFSQVPFPKYTSTNYNPALALRCVNPGRICVVTRMNRVRKLLCAIGDDRAFPHTP